MIQYPMKEWVVTADLLVGGKINRCDVTLKGNVVTDTSENIGMLHLHEPTRNNTVSMKKAERFVSHEQFF